MVDENEAPEGYKAVEAKQDDYYRDEHTCEGCAFRGKPGNHHMCDSYEREDGHTVVFLKREHTN